jgi:hypothetical protein
MLDTCGHQPLLALVLSLILLVTLTTDNAVNLNKPNISKTNP